MLRLLGRAQTQRVEGWQSKQRVIAGPGYLMATLWLLYGYFMATLWGRQRVIAGPPGGGSGTRSRSARTSVIHIEVLLLLPLSVPPLLSAGRSPHSGSAEATRLSGRVSAARPVTACRAERGTA